MIIDFNKIPGHRIFVYIFTITSLVIPGVGLISLKYQNLLPELDIFRLLILAIFFSLPIFVIGITATSYYLKFLPNPNKSDKDKDLRFIGFSSYVTIVIFYFALFAQNLIRNIYPNSLLNSYSPFSLVYFYSIVMAICFLFISHFQSKCK